VDNSPCRFGFYQSPSRCPYPFRILDYYREQASRGMTTAVVYHDNVFCAAGGAEDAALQIEAMLDAGLASAGVPLLATMDGDVLHEAQKYATQPWPELIGAVHDDPGGHLRAALERQVEIVHGWGYRAGTNVSAYHLHAPMDCKTNHAKRNETMQSLGDLLDVWISAIYTWQEDTVELARRTNKELWAICTTQTTGRYDYMRYAAGLWTWAREPKQFLVWAYTHDNTTRVRADGSMSVDSHGLLNSFAIPRPDGTVLSTPGYDGFAHGILDYHALRAASESKDARVLAYLGYVRKTVPYAMRKPGVVLPEPDGETVVAKLNELLEAQTPQSYGTHSDTTGALA